jgi:hypothetical protein
MRREKGTKNQDDIRSWVFGVICALILLFATEPVVKLLAPFGVELGDTDQENER